MFFFCVIISAVTISMMPYFIVHYLGNEVWVFLVAPILGMLASQVAPHVVVALKKVILASFGRSLSNIGISGLIPVLSILVVP